jgi:hypothetical protein
MSKSVRDNPLLEGKLTQSLHVLKIFQNRDESRQYNPRDLNEDSYLIAGALANHQLDVALARSCKSCCDSRQVAVGTEPVGTFWISLLVRNGEE